MKKIKTFHIITRLDKGGSADSTLLTTLLLDHNKYEVFLAHGLTLESDMSSEESNAVEQSLDLARSKGVKLLTIPSLVRRISIINDIRALYNIYRILKRIRPHIVHTHTSKAGALGRLAAYLARTPIIVHTPHGHVFNDYYGPFMTMLFVLAERNLSFVTDKIIAITEQEREEHLAVGVSSKEKYAIIHSGVALDWLMNASFEIDSGKRKFGIPQDCNVVGVVGRLVPIKGHKYLVTAAKKIIEKSRNTVFVFVGDGHLQSELEEQAESIGIRNNIIFTGWRKNVPEIICLFDMLVLPSLNEGMGRVLIEGMALGKPIVASNVGGIINIVKNGENGILLPPKDPNALEDAILQLINNRDLAEKMGKKGRAMVLPEFSSSFMAKRTDDLYQSLLNNKRAVESKTQNIK